MKTIKAWYLILDGKINEGFVYPTKNDALKDPVISAFKEISDIKVKRVEIKILD